jgi:hypothetical protein
MEVLTTRDGPTDGRKKTMTTTKMWRVLTNDKEGTENDNAGMTNDNTGTTRTGDTTNDEAAYANERQRQCLRQRTPTPTNIGDTNSGDDNAGTTMSARTTTQGQRTPGNERGQQ